MLSTYRIMLAELRWPCKCEKVRDQVTVWMETSNHLADICLYFDILVIGLAVAISTNSLVAISSSQNCVHNNFAVSSHSAIRDFAHHIVCEMNHAQQMVRNRKYFLEGPAKKNIGVRICLGSHRTSAQPPALVGMSSFALEHVWRNPKLFRRNSVTKRIF